MSEPGPTLFDRVDSNLGFLILEVTSQVENVRGFLRQPSTAAMRRIVGRDDYVDSLKRLVEEQCFRSFYETQGCAEPTTNLLRATITVAENLERLGDLCLNVVRQSTHLKNPTYLNEPVLDESLNEVLAALQLVRHALTARNVPLAMRICKAEKELDLKYTSTFESILSSLDCSPSREDSLTFLNIVHYIERMGDLLLNIGEAIVFAAVGARMKLGDYVALADMLDVADEGHSAEDLQVEHIWDSRSGMRIGRVFGDDENGAPDLIVKEGNMDKLSRERDSINRWHQLSPGLAPRVYGYREGARMAALLMEYLQGRTMQAVMMAGPDRLAERAYGRFASTIPRLWRMTKTSVPRPVDYVAQLEARLEDVRRLHPQFFSQEKRVGALSVSSLDQLLRRISLSEETMEAPFSVLIHGDFNANNVIYDDEQDRIHFIDLYRSAEGDYIQDASVFLVSCFRIPVLDDEIRSRLNWVAKAFLELVRDFAAEQGDRTVERRLALGLIRSFLTSTRFIPDEVFAEQLFSRAVYLMEALLRSRSGVGFRVPDQIVLWKGRLAA